VSTVKLQMGTNGEKKRKPKTKQAADL